MFSGDNLPKSNGKEVATYTKIYGPSKKSNELRLSLSKGCIEMQRIGDSMQKVYFKTIKTHFTKEDVCGFSPACYAISQYGSKIEFASRHSLGTLLSQLDAYSIYYIIYHYFDPIKNPQEDDLVFYPDSIFQHKKYSLVGIFNKNNSVTSKYDYFSPYVFQHELFFIPNFYGDRALFYRLKNHPVAIEEIYLLPDLRLTPSTPYKLLQDRVTYDPSTSFDQLRYDITCSSYYIKTIPQIYLLEYIQFTELCYYYAFGKFLSTYTAPYDISIIKLNGEILIKYFDATLQPEKGDMVVYYNNDGDPLHYGIYLAENLIESKWGDDGVYRHSYFSIPLEYGNQLKFLKLKPGLSRERLYANLKLDQIKSEKDGQIEKEPVILKEDERGCKTLLLYSYKKPKINSVRQASHAIKKWAPR